jgi:hypothetical protein
MSELHRERDDLPAATQQLLRSQDLGEHIGLPQNRYRWRVAMARIREAEGDLGGALDLLNEAERLYVGDFFPNVRPVPALRARVRVAQGEWVKRSAGRVSEVYPSTTTSATCASSSTSPWPGCSWPGTRQSVRALHPGGDPALGAPPASGRRRAEDGSVIEILVLQALPTRRETTSPLRLHHCDAR